MNSQVVKAVIVFGVSGLVFWLLNGNTSFSKPKTLKEESPAEQNKNAVIVANAYGKAMKDGASAADLEELNKMTEEKYGLRVYKKHKDGKFYVADTKGNDVKKIN